MQRDRLIASIFMGGQERLQLRELCANIDMIQFASIDMLQTAREQQAAMDETTMQAPYLQAEDHVQDTADTQTEEEPPLTDDDIEGINNMLQNCDLSQAERDEFERFLERNCFLCGDLAVSVGANGFMHLKDTGYEGEMMVPSCRKCFDAQQLDEARWKDEAIWQEKCAVRNKLCTTFQLTGKLCTTNQLTGTCSCKAPRKYNKFDEDREGEEIDPLDQ